MRTSPRGEVRCIQATCLGHRGSLRTYGSKTDAYLVFKKMLVSLDSSNEAFVYFLGDGCHV
ncbi:MAG: hypothetical protein WCO97_07820 [bacterium]